MAFGLSDTGKAAVDSFLAGAPGVIDKLAAAGHTLEGELLQGIHSTLSDEMARVDGMENKAISAGEAAEDRLLAAIKPVTDLASTLNEFLSNVGAGRMRIVVSVEPSPAK